MHGEINLPYNYIKFADMLVLSSLIESLPGIIIEAMFLNTLVIAYNVGGISEILDKETRFLVPKINEHAFVRV